MKVDEVRRSEQAQTIARSGSVAGGWVRGSQRPSWLRRSAETLPSTRQAARRMARPPPHADLMVPCETQPADHLSCQRAESSGERPICGVCGQGDPGTQAQYPLQAAGTCLQVRRDVCCLSDSRPGNPPAGGAGRPAPARGNREWRREGDEPSIPPLLRIVLPIGSGAELLGPSLDSANQRPYNRHHLGFGENAGGKHSPCKRKGRFAPPRNTRGRAKAPSGMRLAIRAGWPAQAGRSTYFPFPTAHPASPVR